MSDVKNNMLALGASPETAQTIADNPNKVVAAELATRAASVIRNRTFDDVAKAENATDVRALPGALAGAIRSTYGRNLSGPPAAQSAPVFYAESARAAVERMRTLGQLPGSPAITLRKTGVTSGGSLSLAFIASDLPVNCKIEAPAIRFELTVAGTGSPSEAQISVNGFSVGQTAPYADLIRANPQAGIMGVVYYVPGLASVFGFPRRYPFQLASADGVYVPANAFGSGVPAAPVTLLNNAISNQPPLLLSAGITGLPDGTPCAMEMITPGSRYWEEFLADVSRFAEQ